jgi:hypothetical protein
VKSETARNKIEEVITMTGPREAVAQSFYLAQLQACKNGCQCNVCQLLRKAADDQVEAALNPQAGESPGLESALALVKKAGFNVVELEPGEEGV